MARLHAGSFSRTRHLFVVGSLDRSPQGSREPALRKLHDDAEGDESERDYSAKFKPRQPILGGFDFRHRRFAPPPHHRLSRVMDASAATARTEGMA
jgi:hypothetical protein